MSSNRVKKAYHREIEYGQTEYVNVFAIHNASNDCIYIYDNEGNLIFSGDDALLHTIAELIQSSGQENDSIGIRNMEIEDYILIKEKNK